MRKTQRYAASASPSELASECLVALREWSDLQVRTTRRTTRRANRLADEQRVYLNALVASAEGGRHVDQLLEDPTPGVREWAAARALFWNEPRARQVLEELAASADFPFNFSAEMTLREFDAGRLKP